MKFADESNSASESIVRWNIYIKWNMLRRCSMIHFKAEPLGIRDIGYIATLLYLHAEKVETLNFRRRIVILFAVR